MTEQEAEALLTELQRLAHGGGWRDDEALRRVQAIVFRLRDIRPTGAVALPLAGIEGHFDRLYSARKHANPGIDVLRSRVYNDCARIRMIMRPDENGQVS
jgi:hypothetical protein